MLQFTDSAKFMARSLSILVNNLSEGVHKIECKHGQDEKYLKLVELHAKYVTVLLNTQDNLIEYKCFCCNKN